MTDEAAIDKSVGFSQLLLINDHSVSFLCLLCEMGSADNGSSSKQTAFAAGQLQ